MVRVEAFGLVWLSLLMTPWAYAAEFTSSRGFSIECPEGWLLASKDERDLIKEEVHRAFDRLGNVDLDQMEVLMLHPEDDDFAENINIVVGGRAPRITANSDKEYLAGLSQQLSQMGMRPRNLSSEVTTVGGWKAISARCEVTFPGGIGNVKQWQVVVPAAGKTYIITCSARPADFATVEPVFAKTIESLRISPGLAGLWHKMPLPLRFGLLGGLIGGLVGLVVFFAKKLASPRKTTRSTSSRVLPAELPGNWGQQD